MASASKTMKKIKKALIHVDGVSRAIFFERLMRNGAFEGEIEFHILTESRLAHRILRERGLENVHLLERTIIKKGDRKVISRIDEVYKKSLCGALGTINVRAARSYFWRIEEFFLDNPDIGVIWCWNGTKFVDRAIRDFAQRESIPFKVFEVANIPGCFLVDDDGANAEGRVYSNIQLGWIPPAVEFDYDRWRADYIQAKGAQVSIPQATLANNEIRAKIVELIDLRRSTWRFMYLQVDRLLGYLLKSGVKKILKAWSIQRATGSRIVFFPQQVSTDSQLLFNSKHDNFSAIKLMIGELPKNACLISNLHPAEHRLSVMLRFLFICTKNKNLIPASGGAWHELGRADEVVTINSTVGLEAVILGKPCRFLGQSIFEAFAQSETLLRWYLSCRVIPHSVLENNLSEELTRRMLLDEVSVGY